MSERMTPQLRQAIQRAAGDLPGDELLALLAALELAQARPGTSVEAMLTGMLRQLGHTAEEAAAILAAAAADPLDLRQKLN